MKVILVFLVIIFFNEVSFGQSNAKIQDEVWQREIQYLKYVAANDTAGYKTLWHEQFLGYPGTTITGKNKIADWIVDVHRNKDLHYDYKLVRKAVNVFGDVVVVFYDEDDIFKNNNGRVVSTETFKITYTWKKFGNTWLIIGGMSASIKISN